MKYMLLSMRGNEGLKITVGRVGRGMLLVLMVGAVCRPGAALADQPIHFGGVDTFSDTLCGIPVLVVDCGEATIHPVNADPNATMFTNHVTSTYTAPNGKSLTISGSGQVTETVTANPDGTLTVVDVVHGLGERIAVPGGGTAPSLTRTVSSPEVNSTSPSRT